MTDTTALNAKTTILLATFMWRRRLNSVALANAIHRRPGKVADRTSTQVKIQMINRCRVKMSQKGLYRLKDSPQKNGGGKRGKKKERTFVSFVSCLAIYMNEGLLGYEYLRPQTVNPHSYTILILT